MRQALRFTKETVPGTYPTSPAGTDITHIRIVADSSFPDRPTPNIYYVRDAAGSNRNVQVDYGTVNTTGRFETIGYFSQAKLLFPWGCNLVADGLHLKPAYTFSIDHLMQLEDTGRTVLYKRYLGCYPGDFMFRANNSGDGVKFALSSTFHYLGVATITATDFPTPALNAFPSDNPMKFQQLSGGLTLGSSRTSFKSFELNVKHMTKPIYDESVYPQTIGWFGRDVAWKADFRFKAATDRAAFDAVTARTGSAAITDGTTTLTLDMKSTNITTNVTDSTPLGDAYYQAVGVMSMVDSTAGTDLSAAVTP